MVILIVVALSLPFPTSSPSWIINLFMSSQTKNYKKNTRAGTFLLQEIPCYITVLTVATRQWLWSPEIPKRCTCIMMISISTIEFRWESYLKFSFIIYIWLGILPMRVLPTSFKTIRNVRAVILPEQLANFCH